MTTKIKPLKKFPFVVHVIATHAVKTNFYNFGTKPQMSVFVLQVVTTLAVNTKTFCFSSLSSLFWP